MWTFDLYDTTTLVRQARFMQLKGHEYLLKARFHHLQTTLTFFLQIYIDWMYSDLSL